MNIRQAYDNWSAQYDSNTNKTRDLEAIALQSTLSAITFTDCLETGCGTGKNTFWLIEKAKHITCVDLSEEMLAKAKEKISSDKVQFIQADVTGNWTFAKQEYDLISFSLILEHIKDLDHIFKQASAALKKDGHIYIGELHPFKQYAGSKARFDTEKGTEVLECYTHNISEFIQTAKKYDLLLVDLNEYFDDNDRTSIPRILTLIFKKA